jgi:hypothetical protein
MMKGREEDGVGIGGGRGQKFGSCTLGGAGHLDWTGADLRRPPNVGS